MLDLTAIHRFCYYPSGKFIANRFLVRISQDDPIRRKSELESSRIVGTQIVRLRTLLAWADADHVSEAHTISGHSRLSNDFQHSSHPKRLDSMK